MSLECVIHPSVAFLEVAAVSREQLLYLTQSLVKLVLNISRFRLKNMENAYEVPK